MGLGFALRRFNLICTRFFSPSSFGEIPIFWRFEPFSTENDLPESEEKPFCVDYGIVIQLT